MTTRITLPMLIAALALSAWNSVSADEEVRIEALRVAANIHMLSGKGGNIGVFTGADGTFLVDDQFAPLSEQIITAIEALGGTAPRYLINTHFHGDHTGGNENLGQQGAIIVAHHNVRRSLKNGYVISTFDMRKDPAPKAALPSITYSKNIKFHINGDTVKVMHAPHAHTDGDSFVVFRKANVVHAGDLFFNGFYPFIDADHGGSLRGVIRAVKRLLKVTDEDSKIIPGHGPLANRKQLQAYYDMLKTAYDRLLKLKNQGLSAEEAIEKKPLDDLEADWGDGIFSGDKWISVVYPAVY